MMVAGVRYPCLGCRRLHRLCRKQAEIMKRVFFAMGNGEQVDCPDFEEINWHGLEGVRP